MLISDSSKLFVQVYHKSFEFMLHIHHVKSPQKTLGKRAKGRRLNLEGDWTKLLSNTFKLTSLILPV